MNEAHCELALGYLRVLLSAPPVVLVLMCVFKRDLKALMSRIATIKFPGGQLSTSPQTDPLKKPGLDELPPQETDLPEGLTPPVRNFIQAQQATSRLWEYHFLNLYFVRNTQQVLDWLVNLPNGGISVERFHAFWLPRIPNPNDRISILTALHNHQLITERETMIEITGKGRDYLEWRGPPRP